MRISRTFTILALSGALYCGNALAQTTTNGPVFQVRFSATCQSFDPAKGRVATTRITDRTIIAQATGTSPSGGTTARQFALVYNPTEDSLQVANANGQPIVDVVHFGGGAATADARQLDRFTFMFFPGQTNEFGAETNVFGTAVITERASRTTSSGAATRANITGRLQFALLSGAPLGTTNIDESGTNVQICTGGFTTGGQFPSTTTGAGVAGGTTGANGVTGTNGLTGSTGTVATTPLIIVTTPIGVLPSTTAGITSTTLGSTTGMLPSLTGNGSLPGLGTAIGTGQVVLTPFNTVTPGGIGTPVTTTTPGSIPLGTTTIGTTTLGTTGTGTAGTTTSVGVTSITGTTTGTLTPSGSLSGF